MDGLKLKYFVVKPAGRGGHAQASRADKGAFHA